MASLPCEILPSREFYDYEDKYCWTRRKPCCPADLPPEKTAEVRRLAVECYRAVECEGMARVDFLLEAATGRLYINEINTIPGFTSISMYPKMWEQTGLPYAEADRPADRAGARAPRRQARPRATQDDVLDVDALYLALCLFAAPPSTDDLEKRAEALHRGASATVETAGGRSGRTRNRPSTRAPFPACCARWTRIRSSSIPSSFEQLKQMEKSERKGFGTVVSVLPGRVIVLQTLPGTPSAKAGLQPGDEILAINNVRWRGSNSIKSWAA